MVSTDQFEIIDMDLIKPELEVVYTPVPFEARHPSLTALAKLPVGIAEVGKEFIKGAVPGAELAEKAGAKLAELITGKKREEIEIPEWQHTVARLAGETIPIGVAGKYVAKPIEFAAKNFKYLRPFARMLGWGVAGSAYETVRRLADKGELPEPAEIVEDGIAWGAIEGALNTIGYTGKLIWGIRKLAKTLEIPRKEAIKIVVEEAKKQGLFNLPDIILGKANVQEALKRMEKGQIKENAEILLQAIREKIANPEQARKEWEAIKQTKKTAELAREYGFARSVAAREALRTELAGKEHPIVPLTEAPSMPMPEIKRPKPPEPEIIPKWGEPLKKEPYRGEEIAIIGSELAKEGIKPDFEILSPSGIPVKREIALQTPPALRTAEQLLEIKKASLPKGRTSLAPFSELKEPERYVEPVSELTPMPEELRKVESFKIITKKQAQHVPDLQEAKQLTFTIKPIEVGETFVPKDSIVVLKAVDRQYQYYTIILPNGTTKDLRIRKGRRILGKFEEATKPFPYKVVDDVELEINKLNKKINATKNPDELSKIYDEILSLKTKKVSDTAYKQLDELGQKVLQKINKTETLSFLGTQQIYEELKKVGSKVLTPFKQPAQKVIKDFNALFRPEALTEEAKKAAGIVREAKARRALEEYKFLQDIEKRIDAWEKLPKEIQLDYLMKVEEGKINELPEQLRQIAKADREIYNLDYELSKKLDDVWYVENYIPHFFKDVEKARAFFKQYWARIPKEPHARKRVFPTIRAALQYGLELKSTNPEVIKMWRHLSALEAEMWARIIDNHVEAGLLRPYKQGTKLAAGEAIISTPKGMMVGPESVVRVLDRNLQKSIYAGDAVWNQFARGLLYAKNITTAAKLAINLFHFWLTSTVDVTNRFIVFLKDLAHKDFLSAFKSLTKVPVSPFLTVREGSKLRRIMLEGPKNAVEEKIYKLFLAGGLRISMPPEYKVRASKAFRKTIQETKLKKTILAAPRIFYDIVEKLNALIMDWYIPRIKLGAWVEGVQNYIKNHPHASWEEITEYARRLSDSMDNRYGELIYDNLNWQRWIRDIGVLTNLSLSWNLGDIREFGGAALHDLPDLIKKLNDKEKKVFVDRLLFTVFYPVVMGAIGWWTHKLLTGKDPETVTDLVYPETGVIRPDGSRDRILIPSYLKDAFSIREAIKKKGIVKGLATVAGHKLAPLFAWVYDILTNKDFYNVQIRDPRAPWYIQTKQVAESFINLITPIPHQSFKQTGYYKIIANAVAEALKTGEVKEVAKEAWQEMKQLPERTGETWFDAVAPWLGFTKAPGYVTQTPIQKEIFKVFQERYNIVRTKDEWKARQFKKELRDMIQRGESVEKIKRKLLEGLRKNVFGHGLSADKKRSLRMFLRTAKLPSDVKAFMYLGIQDQMYILEKALEESPQEFIKYLKHAKKAVKIRWLKKLKGLTQEPKRTVRGGLI